VQADGGEITTIEGIADAQTGELSRVQQAFREHHGLQCGFCTPGFITTVTAFLRDNPSPTDEEIREALSGNLCRCTGYQGILAAVRSAREITPESLRIKGESNPCQEELRARSPSSPAPGAARAAATR
jgi:carbon-monoxide dehydrogenase small subunit